MSVDFATERWEAISSTYSKWWQGTLERPIVPVVLTGKDPGRPEPKAPFLSQATCHDFTFSPAEIIDRVDYELTKEEYLGDAFPFMNLSSFGPGVVAAFLGCELDNSTGRVWFHPKEILPIHELHFEYDPSNKWLNRIKDIYAAGISRWQGQVLMGMPDMGGILDVLSSFRPADNLLFDLYDSPEEVKRCIWEIHGLWYRYYDEFNAVLQPVNPGYTDWLQIYSPKPSYVLQSDFSYMISPEMFKEFTLPELQASCRRLSNTIYHLDGTGQLPHLDYLLGIEELKAVQWGPGQGKPDQSQWPDVQRKIHRAGKNVQIDCGFDGLARVAGQIGTCKGIHSSTIWEHISNRDEVVKKLAEYGIEERL
jgi:hypothetical protein